VVSRNLLGEITDNHGKMVKDKDKITPRYFFIALHFVPLLSYGTYLLAVG